ncbi:FitA-like ribbon-helix-helix domain-containing protein [Nocardia cyriacigeorgica]|jgi:antitoxin FitA|uniref:FitA-like ribbon-helix-helix domain-containing protein n=1 Tax=Nocardia cyriacigeorgica TaxID=135487 RepID=UPI00031C42B7|nr:hypothetical protein [Nocardia cyriacigeorgica]MBF6325645.1 antitoxin [Nocardia cyriacigeorgica]MBF6415671.1 antitoxin [Nocardia cyriacigeorgica]TLF61192.1 antitoxin [Nocardia cyriacigeorgica]
MVTIEVRDIPDDDAEVLRQRAAAAGLSLEEHIREQLIASARRQYRVEALEDIRKALAANPLPGENPDQVVENLRREFEDC